MHPEEKLENFEPLAITHKRFLWSPTTGISDPKAIAQAMLDEFISLGGTLAFGKKIKLVESDGEIHDHENLFQFKHLVNAAGAQAPAGNTTTNAYCSVQAPVPMRARPTSVDFSGLETFDSGSASSLVTAAALTSVIQGNLMIGVEFTASGLTVGRTAFIRNNNNSAAYLGFSAEL
jgi:hypothetical protein